MVTKTDKLLFLFLGALLALLIAACGPADTSATIRSGEESLGEAESATAATSRPEVAVAAADENAPTTDANGIPVGYTDDGRAFRGDPDAPVVLEAFSDFQCPFCARFSEQTLPGLLENQIADGDVLLVFYDFPLESIHPQAFAAANAARCAGEAGAAAYWEMHDLLFANIQQWPGSDPTPHFSAYADELGLDVAAFDACVAENRYADAVQADLDEGQARGVRSTPSFFLNGQALVGAQPLEAFNSAIAQVSAGETLAQAQEASPATTLDSVLIPRPEAPTPVDIPEENVATAVGDPDAPVTIVEYTDYQCPYCQQHAQTTLPQILSELVETGDVYYVIKDLPLDNIHPDARSAAVAARCAGEQDAYMAMHDALFAAQSQWAGQGEAAQNAYVALAADLDLDTDAFAACLEEDRYADAVQANVDEALAFGVQSTPSFFINGLPLSGARPFELFAYAVDLAQEGTLADAYVPPEPQVEGAYSVGDPNAPVTIIEYTDFQCPFCSRHFSNSFPQIKENYIDTGQVHYIFKDFPLTNIHPQATKAAEAARCAGDQDAYLEMHHTLFERQAEWSGSANATELFSGYAAELGLETGTFDQCLQSGAHEAAVQADLEEAVSMGFNGTPAFIINEHFMSGAQPYELFAQAIERFLAE